MTCELNLRYVLKTFGSNFNERKQLTLLVEDGKILLGIENDIGEIVAKMGVEEDFAYSSRMRDYDLRSLTELTVRNFLRLEFARDFGLRLAPDYTFCMDFLNYGEGDFDNALGGMKILYLATFLYCEELSKPEFNLCSSAISDNLDYYLQFVRNRRGIRRSIQ